MFEIAVFFMNKNSQAHVVFFQIVIGLFSGTLILRYCFPDNIQMNFQNAARRFLSVTNGAYI